MLARCDAIQKSMFVGFDYVHDDDAYYKMLRLSRMGLATFKISNSSAEYGTRLQSKHELRSALSQNDIFVGICGNHTARCPWLNEELETALSLNMPFYLLAANDNGDCEKPISAPQNAKIYTLSAENLELLTGGVR